MPFLEWSDKFKTGVPDIDKEHQHLFALINDLFDKVEEGAEEASILSTIQALTEYVEFHFAGEETLMAICRYDDLERHKEKHRQLEAKVSGYLESYVKDTKAFDMEDFVYFLSEWLQDHILRTDMAYVPQVQERISGL